MTGSLELVGVQRPHHQAIERHDPALTGLCSRLVGFVTPGHVQMGSLHLTAQDRRVGCGMDIASLQPAHLSPVLPGTGHEQHDVPVPCRPVRPQQGHNVVIRCPVHHRFELVLAVEGPKLSGDAVIPPECLLGQIGLVHHLVDRRHQPGRPATHPSPPCHLTLTTPQRRVAARSGTTRCVPRRSASANPANHTSERTE